MPGENECVITIAGERKYVDKNVVADLVLKIFRDKDVEITANDIIYKGQKFDNVREVLEYLLTNQYEGVLDADNINFDNKALDNVQVAIDFLLNQVDNLDPSTDQITYNNKTLKEYLEELQSRIDNLYNNLNLPLDAHSINYKDINVYKKLDELGKHMQDMEQLENQLENIINQLSIPMPSSYIEHDEENLKSILDYVLNSIKNNIEDIDNLKETLEILEETFKLPIESSDVSYYDMTVQDKLTFLAQQVDELEDLETKVDNLIKGLEFPLSSELIEHEDVLLNEVINKINDELTKIDDIEATLEELDLPLSAEDIKYKASTVYNKLVNLAEDIEQIDELEKKVNNLIGSLEPPINSDLVQHDNDLLNEILDSMLKDLEEIDVIKDEIKSLEFDSSDIDHNEHTVLEELIKINESIDALSNTIDNIEDEIDLEVEGANGAVFITDVSPANEHDMVDTTYDDTNTIVEKIRATTGQLELTIMGITGHSNYKPNVYVNGNHVSLSETSDFIRFEGSIEIDSKINDTILLEHEDGANYELVIKELVDVMPEITGAEFVSYPGMQTEYKLNDEATISVETTIEPDYVEVDSLSPDIDTIQNEQFSVSSTSNIIKPNVNYIEEGPQELTARVRLIKDGNTTEWYQIDNTATFCNIRPSIQITDMHFSDDLDYLTAYNYVEVVNSITNFDGVEYSSPGSELDITSPEIYEEFKRIDANASSNSVDNLVITAYREANDTNETYTATIEIDDKPTIQTLQFIESSKYPGDQTVAYNGDETTVYIEADRNIDQILVQDNEVFNAQSFSANSNSLTFNPTVYSDLDLAVDKPIALTIIDEYGMESNMYMSTDFDDSSNKTITVDNVIPNITINDIIYNSNNYIDETSGAEVQLTVSDFDTINYESIDGSINIQESYNSNGNIDLDITYKDGYYIEENNLRIEAFKDSNATSSSVEENIEIRIYPEISSVTIGDYPEGQTELKNGDNIEITVNSDIDLESIDVLTDNFVMENVKSSNNIYELTIESSLDTTSSNITITGNTDYGLYTDEYTTTNTVEINNTEPAITIDDIIYPNTEFDYTYEEEEVELYHSITNFDSTEDEIQYSNIDTNSFSIPNRFTFNNPKTLTPDPEIDSEIGVDNLRIKVNKASNGATVSKDISINIDNRPEIFDVYFDDTSGNMYPEGQIVLSDEDVTELTVESNTDIHAVVVDGYQALKGDTYGGFTPQNKVTINPVVEYTDESLQQQSARIKIVDSDGVESGWQILSNLTEHDNTDKYRRVDCDNSFIEITVNNIEYDNEYNEEYLYDEQTAIIDHSMPNFDTLVDTVEYTSPNGQLLIEKPDEFESLKQVSRILNTGEVNETETNLIIKATNQANNNITEKEIVIVIKDKADIENAEFLLNSYDSNKEFMTGDTVELAITASRDMAEFHGISSDAFTAKNVSITGNTAQIELEVDYDLEELQDHGALFDIEDIHGMSLHEPFYTGDILETIPCNATAPTITYSITYEDEFLHGDYTAEIDYTFEDGTTGHIESNDQFDIISDEVVNDTTKKALIKMSDSYDPDIVNELTIIAEREYNGQITIEEIGAEIDARDLPEITNAYFVSPYTDDRTVLMDGDIATTVVKADQTIDEIQFANNIHPIFEEITDSSVGTNTADIDLTVTYSGLDELTDTVNVRVRNQEGTWSVWRSLNDFSDNTYTEITVNNNVPVIENVLVAYPNENYLTDNEIATVTFDADKYHDLSATAIDDSVQIINKNLVNHTFDVEILNGENVDHNNIMIEASRDDNLTESYKELSVQVRDYPEITTFEFTDNKYPSGQTEIRDGQTTSVYIETDKPMDEVIIQGNSTFDGATIQANSNTSMTIELDVNYLYDIPSEEIVEASVISDTGLESDSKSTINSITCNNLHPTINIENVIYLGDENYLYDEGVNNQADIYNTASDYDTIEYISNELDINSPLNYEEYKTVERASNVHENNPDNLTIKAKRDANGSETTATAVVEIDNSPVITDVTFDHTSYDNEELKHGENVNFNVIANQTIDEVEVTGGEFKTQTTSIHTAEVDYNIEEEITSTITLRVKGQNGLWSDEFTSTDTVDINNTTPNIDVILPDALSEGDTDDITITVSNADLDNVVYEELQVDGQRQIELSDTTIYEEVKQVTCISDVETSTDPNLKITAYRPENDTETIKEVVVPIENIAVDVTMDIIRDHDGVSTTKLRSTPEDTSLIAYQEELDDIETYTLAITSSHSIDSEPVISSGTDFEIMGSTQTTDGYDITVRVLNNSARGADQFNIDSIIVEGNTFNNVASKAFDVSGFQAIYLAFEPSNPITEMPVEQTNPENIEFYFSGTRQLYTFTPDMPLDWSDKFTFRDDTNPFQEPQFNPYGDYFYTGDDTFEFWIAEGVEANSETPYAYIYEPAE